MHLSVRYRCVLAMSVALPAGLAAAPATPASAPSGAARAAADKAEHDRLVAELTSKDPAQVDAAVEQVRQAAANRYGSPGDAMRVLLEAKLYDRAEAVAEDYLRKQADSSSVDSVQRFRVEVQQQQGHWPQAIAAARSYYDVAVLGDTKDAINLMSLCLVRGRPDDPGLARRFKRQQAAWATAAPPADAVAGAAKPAAADDLGPPVLATIPVDDKPFAATAAALEPVDYTSCERKGNLLLLCGRPKEARSAFEQAEALSTYQGQTAAAIEGQARAIRAERGCVGPANEFLAALQK